MENEKAIEIARKKKNGFDQMASMHFLLSDKYLFRSKVEDTIEIVISVALCGVTFLDYEKFLGCKSNWPILVMGFISIFLLAFTLIKQRLDYKKLSEKHNLAGKMYSRAKLDLNAKISEWEIMETESEDILQCCNNRFLELNELPQIPEKEFIRLKHAHQSKVEFSKFLDTHKRDCLLMCKFKFWFGKRE